MNNALNICLKKNVLNKEEIEKILNCVKNIEVWETGGVSSFWENRVLSAKNIYDNYDKDVGSLLYETREKIAFIIKEFYSLEEVYSDIFQVIRWFPESSQLPHQDDMKNSENTEWFHHRDYGAILYLNNDFYGGETYYPNSNIKVIPEPGKLAVHPGDELHTHGVATIKNQIRYTLASFWTKNKEYADGWTIHK